MIAFINDHRKVYGVEPICRMLPIDPSTYHAHAARRADPAKASPRTRRGLVMVEQIGRVHAASLGSMAPARSGGSSAGRASWWPVARWND